MAAKKYLTPIDLSQQEIQNAVIQLLATDPASPVNGQIWVNSTSGVFKARLGGTTISFGRLDQLSPPTSGVGLNGQRITGLADGSASSDAATVGQVQASQTGLDVKASVRVATTAAGTLSTSYASGQTVDGIALATGDRILIKNQATASENGIYTVSASGAPVRAVDADTSAEVTPGLFTFVEQGTANAATGWVLSTSGAITLGTTGLSFVKFSAPANSIGKYNATGPATAGTSWTVTHSLGTQEVAYTLRDATSNAEVIADAVLTDASTLTFSFGASQASNSLKVVVIG